MLHEAISFARNMRSWGHAAMVLRNIPEILIRGFDGPGKCIKQTSFCIKTDEEIQGLCVLRLGKICGVWGDMLEEPSPGKARA